MAGDNLTDVTSSFLNHYSKNYIAAKRYTFNSIEE
jgi:hypothetical protein